MPRYTVDIISALVSATIFALLRATVCQEVGTRISQLKKTPASFLKENCRWASGWLSGSTRRTLPSMIWNWIRGHTAETGQRVSPFTGMRPIRIPHIIKGRPFFGVGFECLAQLLQKG